MTSPTFHIPNNELALPEPPVGHRWQVRNIISTTETHTDYSIQVRLFNPDDVVVMTVAETWDRKQEAYSDFAMSIVGLSIAELYAYLSFLSITWDRDNPEWEKTTPVGSENLTVTEWFSPRGKEEETPTSSDI